MCRNDEVSSFILTLLWHGRWLTSSFHVNNFYVFHTVNVRLGGDEQKNESRGKTAGGGEVIFRRCVNCDNSVFPLERKRETLLVRRWEIVDVALAKNSFRSYLCHIFNVVSFHREEESELGKMCDDTIPTCVNMKHGTIQQWGRRAIATSGSEEVSQLESWNRKCFGREREWGNSSYTSRKTTW